jgi:hypothetical protein
MRHGNDNNFVDADSIRQVERKSLHRNYPVNRVDRAPDLGKLT